MGNVTKVACKWKAWVEETSQYKEDFIECYNEESCEEYFIQVYVVHYSETLHELRNNLAFLSKRMKIEKVKKSVANLNDEKEYVIHMTNLKQALNHGLVLKKVHTLTKFNQKAWLKPYIDMNTERDKKEDKKLFQKILFQINELFSF